MSYPLWAYKLHQVIFHDGKYFLTKENKKQNKDAQSKTSLIGQKNLKQEILKAHILNSPSPSDYACSSNTTLHEVLNGMIIEVLNPCSYTDLF